jgi:hypothetical protein
MFNTAILPPRWNGNCGYREPMKQIQARENESGRDLESCRTDVGLFLVSRAICGDGRLKCGAGHNLVGGRNFLQRRLSIGCRPRIIHCDVMRLEW